MGISQGLGEEKKPGHAPGLPADGRVARTRARSPAPSKDAKRAGLAVLSMRLHSLLSKLLRLLIFLLWFPPSAWLHAFGGVACLAHFLGGL